MHTEISDAETTAPPAAPAEMRRLLGGDHSVAVDFPCDGCGYNLRTLQETATCPGCGAAVAVTVRRAGLLPTVWLQNIAAGATCLAISLCALSAVAMVYAIGALAEFGFSYRVSTLFDMAATGLFLVLIIAPLLAVFAIGGLTTDPGAPGIPLPVRVFVRSTLIATFALLMIGAIFLEVTGPIGGGLLLLAVLVGSGCVVGVFAHLGSVLDHVGSRAHALAARVCGVSLGAFEVSALAFLELGNNGPFLIGYLSVGLLGLLAATCVVWRAARVLRAAARAAKGATGEPASRMQVSA